MNKLQKPSISILGCGWYGLPLAKKLIEKGYIVKGSTTSSAKLASLSDAQIIPFLVDFELNALQFEERFFDCAILLISIPPKSNSPSLIDYPAKIKQIALAAEKAGVEHIIFISSSGVYPDRNVVVNESVVPQPNTAAGKAIFEAEETLRQYASFTTTVLRFAGLIGPDRNLAKHFAGKGDLANGLAPINLIHLNDCIGITLAIIEQKAFGPTYHGVAPHHPNRNDFYTKACLKHGFLAPQFKAELLQWKQIESTNVPALLAYQFEIENWDTWLNTAN